MYNIDSEIGTLNILLNNPDLAESTPNLKPFMYSASTNSCIYDCIYTIQSQGHIPDWTLVLNKLIAEGKIDQAGGKEYLEYIKSSTEFTKENLPEFTKQIINGYKARSLVSITSNINKKVETEDIDTVISNLETQLGNLQENSASDKVVDFYSATKEAWSDIEFRLNNPGITGITTGLKSLDLLTGGYNKGKLWIIASRPSTGKSTVLCNSVLRGAEAMKGTGEYQLVFSLEMQNTELITRMLANHTGVPLEDILFGTLTQKQLESIQEAMKYFKTLPILLDDTPGTNLNRFTSIVRRYNRTKKIRVVHFDYLQLGVERDDGQMNEIGRFTKGAKVLAKELDLTCVFYSQLNRGVESRDDKRPILSDLRQSGNIEEDADIVDMLYRDELYNGEKSKYKNIMEHLIRKHRNGKVGMFTSRFDGALMRITDD
jgi:replicative DNA helicase